MRVVFFGSGDFGVPALHCLAAEHEVVRVCCPPPHPAKRHLHSLSCAAAAAAKQSALPLSESESLEEIAAECRPDVVIVCDYGKLLSPQVLAIAPRGALNIHPSLLPRWRGAAPVQRTILAGDKTTGITIMQMDAGLDTGAILLQKQISVAPDICCGDLRRLLAADGAALLLQALRDNPPPQPQKESDVRYAAKIRPADYVLNFNHSAEMLARQIRALSPLPGARILHGDEIIKVYAARETSGGGAPGRLLSADKNGIVVACGAGALTLLRVQKPGRRIMDAAEFVRGWRDIPPAFRPPANDFPRPGSSTG